MSAPKSVSLAEDTVDTESLFPGDDEQAVQDRIESDVVREQVEQMASGVSSWLEKQANGEEGSSHSSDSVGLDGGPGSASAVAFAVTGLSDLTKRVVRISKQQMAVRFRRARAVYSSERRGGERRMLQYSLKGSRAVLELETAGGIYDELNSEKRVVTQVVARTAIGKTTRLPSMIATRCNRRVLLVEPDTRLARAAADRQRGLVRVRTPWMTSRMPVLTTMSYHDFCGHFRGQNGADMLDRFDVIMFDEAHKREPEVDAAKSLVATYSTTASLLVCSATIEADDVQSTGAAISIQYTAKPLWELVREGHLLKGTLARDRTMIIATDDQEAQKIGTAIMSAGFTARVLDSASKYEDQMRVAEFLEEPDSVVNRYLVVVPEFGYGHNFPVGFVVTSARKVQHRMVDGGKRLEAAVVLCSKQEVKQQCHRAARGIVEGASALVCAAPEELPDEESSSYADVLRHYVLMVASGVRPTTDLTEAVKGLLPFGLNARVAADLLAINLPLEVAIRFFAEDGRVPYKYVQALQTFSEDRHEFMVSDFEQPYGYDKWVQEPMSGYYGDVDPMMPSLGVPCHAVGNVKVAIHAVCASSLGLMSIEDWQPQFADSGDSGEEVRPRTRATSDVYVPRMIADRSPVRAMKPLPNPYSYDVPYEKQFAVRSRVAIHGDFVSPETLQGLAALDVDVSRKNFDVSCEVTQFTDGRTDRVGIVKRVGTSAASSSVDVHSPGGSVVMAFRSIVWKKMVNGDALEGSDALSFFHSIKNNVEGFVQSDAFSGWTDVWFSIFRTASNADNLRAVKDNNYTSRIVSLLLAMVVRYAGAVQEVSKSSMIKAGFFRAMLSSSVSYEDVYRRQSTRGRAEIAQSEQFVRRVFDIRDVMAHALQETEAEGVFAPGVITQLQKMLPLMRRTGIGVVDRPTVSRRFLVRRGYD